MTDETYNGWVGKGSRASAYATWRIALEVFDGRDPEDYGWSHDDPPTSSTLAENLRDECNEIVDDSVDNTYVAGWVNAFLDDVNFEEIAELMLSDWEPDDDETRS